MSSGTAERYAAPAIILHWLTAAAFVFQIALGWRMHAPPGPAIFVVYQLHKSIGITILVLTMVRIAWRLANTPPPFSATMRPIERHVARVVHILFYLLLIALPLSGWLIVSSSRIAVPTILFGHVPWPNLPLIGTLDPASRGRVNLAASTLHAAGAWLAIGAIFLHVAGALKHQFVDHGAEFGRMTGLPSRMLSLGALCTCVALLGFYVLGLRVRLKSPQPIIANYSAVRLPPIKTVSIRTGPATAPSPVVASAAPIAASHRPYQKVTTSYIWTMRKDESSIRFHTAWSQGPVEGGFRTWRAQIRFDPSAFNDAVVTITVDLASVFASDEEQQHALPASDWLAVSAHPTATWRATRFHALGGERYRADGTLTLRGISRALPLAFTLHIAGDVATVTGTAAIDRTLFGVGQGEWASTSDLPAGVGLRIALKADRAPATPKTTLRETQP